MTAEYTVYLSARLDETVTLARELALSLRGQTPGSRPKNPKPRLQLPDGPVPLYFTFKIPKDKSR